MRDSGGSETFLLWPGSGRPETEESFHGHCRSRRGASERMKPNKNRQGETGRSVRQRRQAGAAPTFQAVQRDRSVRAEGPRKGSRRAGNGAAGDPDWGPTGQQCPRRIPERETAWDPQDPGRDPIRPGKFFLPSPAGELDPRKAGVGGDTSPRYAFAGCRSKGTEKKGRSVRRVTRSRARA